MNCLSESGTCQAIAQQNPFVKRSRKQHCTFKQISRNGLERVTKRPPASVLHHQQQRNNRKASRNLVACQASQLSGPGAWGEAVSASVLLVVRRTAKQSPWFLLSPALLNTLTCRVTRMLCWWLTLEAPIAALYCGDLTCRTRIMRGFSARQVAACDGCRQLYLRLLFFSSFI